MGVPGFFTWLLRNKKISSKKLIIDAINAKIKYLMLDTNCLLHPCVAYILEKYKNNKITLNPKKSIRHQLENLIWERIKLTIDDMITRLSPEYIYIAIDGVAPIGKILQQRQRRYKYLFDKKIKLTPEKSLDKSLDKSLEESLEEIEQVNKDGIYITSEPVSSIELTPGTDYMERIHNKMIEYLVELKKSKIKCIYSSYHEPGEGEHKILQYIKKNIRPEELVVIYGLDADLLFLALSTGENYNLYVMREQQIFNNTELNLDEKIDYNYVEISELHKMISKLEINTNDFITICYLVGNDFLPGLLTTDIKKSGLDKILTAYETVKKIYKNHELCNIITIKMENNQKKIKINYEFLKEIFINLIWTEKWTWNNINRDNINRDNIKKEYDEEEIEKLKYKKEDDKVKKMNNFMIGTSANIECFDRIEFSSKLEYYNYYLGLEEMSINTSIIKRMVRDYITGIEWCINYYLDDCISWKWGYNFLIAPLISDIIAYYPKKVLLMYSKCELRPVEQLILAIPPDTYKYVISSDIIERLKKEKRIGYMFPDSYDIDINKESLYWKCQVKIPIVEYEEYISVIKSLNIMDIKNNIENSIQNF